MRKVFRRHVGALLTVALCYTLFISASHAATMGSFSSDCVGVSQDLVASDSAAPLGLTVSGPVSLQQEGSGICTADWAAKTRVELPEGIYVIGNVIDFLYDLIGQSASSDGFAVLDWAFTTTLHAVNDSAAIQAINTWTSQGSLFRFPSSGHVNVTEDSAVPFELDEGSYILTQTAHLELTLRGGGAVKADLDFPLTSFVGPPTAAPEPATLLSLVAGLGLLALGRRRPIA